MFAAAGKPAASYKKQFLKAGYTMKNVKTSSYTNILKKSVLMYLSYANTNVLTKAASPKRLRRRSIYAFSKLPILLFRQYGSV